MFLVLFGWIRLSPGCREGRAMAAEAGGRLAQLVERLVYTERVGGSSPSPPTSCQAGTGEIQINSPITFSMPSTSSASTCTIRSGLNWRNSTAAFVRFTRCMTNAR